MKWSKKKSFQVFCVPFIGLTFLVLPLLPSASNHPPHTGTRAHTQTHTYTSGDIQAPSQKIRNFVYVSQDNF